jgi:hypothetical protein
LVMDTTLVGVTLLSMAMAVALSTVVWRLLRDERRRSEARVAALADMMARAGAEDARKSSRPFVSEPHVVRGFDLALNEPSPHVASAPLFTEPEHSSPWRGRAVIMGALALAATAALLVALTIRDRGRAQAAAAGSTTAAAAQPLELLSLRDSRDGNTLTISGVVQNPRNSGMLRQVTVTALAFDAGGTQVASGHALIDITALAPGDESPFVVSVPLTGAVARYRIGFRGEDGRVIAHVDRRQRGAVAEAASTPVAGT